MDFFERFSWGVPHAFVEALSSCRFEEGDILYDDRRAYDGKWDEGQKHPEYFIQVVFPPRSVGGSQSFVRNWESSVHFDFYSPRDNKRRIETTQGRLYTMLWGGNVGGWDVKPQLPLGVKDIPKEAVCVESLVSVSPKPPFFVLAVDSANQMLRTKKKHIHIATKKHLYREPRVIELKNICLSNWGKFAPTIELILFEAPETSKERLHDRIKSVVYKPSTDAKKDMFRIDAHGWLFGKDHDAGTSLFG